VTVAVSVTTVPDSTEVTALPWLVTASVVAVLAAVKARPAPANIRRNSAVPTVTLTLLTTLLERPANDDGEQCEI
jgi:hypothetical protein